AESSTTPWLADDGEGNLRALWPTGRLDGEALPAGGDLLPVVAASESSWVAAVREGKAFGVTWEDSGSSGWHLVRTWEMAFEERLTEESLAGGRMVVRFEGGSLMGIDASARELWRLRLSAGDRFELLPQAASLVIMSASELRLYDWASGHQTFQWNVQSP